MTKVIGEIWVNANEYVLVKVGNKCVQHEAPKGRVWRMIIIEATETERGISYDTPRFWESLICPKCGSKDIGRTPEVCSLFKSPLMCCDCRHKFGGNLPPGLGGSNL